MAYRYIYAKVKWNMPPEMLKHAETAHSYWVSWSQLIRMSDPVSSSKKKFHRDTNLDYWFQSPEL